MPTITGTSSSETLRGTDEDDRILTNDGYDTVYGGMGDDEINGYPKGERDSLGLWRSWTYWDSADPIIVYGGSGNDFIIGGQSGDEIYGEDGNDYIVGYEGNDIVRGGIGDDYLSGREGDDLLYGDAGNDVIRVDDGNDAAFGGDGDDRINGYINNKDLNRVINWTYFNSENGKNTLYGGDGNDEIVAGLNGDKLYGENGNDILIGRDGDDYLDGGEGDDWLVADDGNDTLVANNGFDFLSGGDGDDTYVINTRYFEIYDKAGDDRAVVNVDFVKIPEEIETISYADGVQRLPYWIDSLVDEHAAAFSGYLDQEKTFTYSFPATMPEHYDGDYNEGFSRIKISSQNNIHRFFANISSFLDLIFIETENVSQLNNIAIWTVDTGIGGNADYPDDVYNGSDVRVDSRYENISEDYYGSHVFVHELGHALGLKHPFSEPSAGSGHIDHGPYLPDSEDVGTWTQMTYNVSNSEREFKFRPLDIAALQYIYGPSRTERTGDNTYYINSDAPNFIWDGGGTDTIDASSLGERITLHLSAGYHDFIGASSNDLITASGQITINFGSVIENLKGTSFSDDLYGNEEDNEIQGNSGDDTVFGGEGDDKLDNSGTFGDDTLYGGPGDDKYYVYELSGDDKFIEYESEGDDTVYTSVSFSLDNTPHVENLYSFSDVDSNLDLVGNTLDNRLASSQGNCTIDGSSGDDTVWYGWNYFFEECYIFYRDGVLNVEKGNGSIDKLFNIEFLAFSDTTVAVNEYSFDNLDTSIAVSAAKSEYDEGESIIFILASEGLEQGTKVGYTITGISEEDLNDDALTGEFIVGDNGQSTVTISLAQDELTEGDESLTLALNEYEDQSITIKVKDTSVASVFLTEKYRTSILVDAGIISEDPILIHNLPEEISTKNGQVISHFFSYA